MTDRRTTDPARSADAPSDIVLGLREHLFVVEAAVELEARSPPTPRTSSRAFEAGGKVLAFGNGGSAAMRSISPASSSAATASRGVRWRPSRSRPTRRS